MALQINGTTVVNNSRQLQNIASVDATTAATIAANAGGGYEIIPFDTGATDKDVALFAKNYSTSFTSAGFEATAAYNFAGDNTVDNMIIAERFGVTGGSNPWFALGNTAGSSKKIEIFSTTNVTTQLDSSTVKTGPDSNGYYKYVRTVPANTAAYGAYVWYEPTLTIFNVAMRWQPGITMWTRPSSGRANGWTTIHHWFQGDVGF